jgi:hypothetical protein
MAFCHDRKGGFCWNSSRSHSRSRYLSVVRFSSLQQRAVFLPLKLSSAVSPSSHCALHSCCAAISKQLPRAERSIIVPIARKLGAIILSQQACPSAPEQGSEGEQHMQGGEGAGQFSIIIRLE